MSEVCSQNCSECDSDCADRKSTDFQAPANASSNVKSVIGVVSGKGGVGKTLVTSLLAVSMRRAGYASAVLDADITGPSVPRAFGLHEKAVGSKTGIIPVMTKSGIPVMSINLLLDKETDPIIWRGPVIAGTVKQFWSDVNWGEVDYMFVDMPPGTGDVPLTVFQSIPLDGVVVVASPQELVGMVVEKAVNMADMMNIPVLALVENMSYFQCPDCGREHRIFGESHIGAIAENHGIGTVCKIPIDSRLAAATDAGAVEDYEGGYMDELVKMLEKRPANKSQEEISDF